MSENEIVEDAVAETPDVAETPVAAPEADPPRLVFKGEKRPEVAQSVAAVFLLTLGLAAIGSGAWGGAWRNATFLVHLINVGLLFALLERIPWGNPDRRKVSALLAAFIFGAFPLAAAYLLASGALATAASMGFVLAGLLLMTLPKDSTAALALAPACVAFAGLCTPWGLVAAPLMVVQVRGEKVRTCLVIAGAVSVITVSAALGTFPVLGNPACTWLGSIAPLAEAYSSPLYHLYLVAALFALLVYRIQFYPQLKVLRNLVIAAVILFSVAVTALGSFSWRYPVNMLDVMARHLPGNPIVQRCYGDSVLSLMERGESVPDTRIKQAEAAFRKAHEIAPDDARATGGLGRILTLSDRPDEAIPLLTQALAGDSRQGMCAAYLADIYAEKARFSRKPEYTRPALDYFRAADSAGVLKAPSLVSYGVLSARMGDVEGAVVLLTRAAYTAQAEMLLSGQVTGGTQEFVSMIKQRIEEFQAAAKRQSEIEQSAMSILGKQPEDPGGMKMLAELLVMRSQETRARYILDNLCKDGVPDIQTWLLLGTIAARVGSAKEFIAQNSTPPASNDEAGRDPWGALTKRCMQDQTWDAAAAYCGAKSADVPVLGALGRAAMDASQQAGAIAYLSSMETPSAAQQLVLADLYLSVTNKESARNALTRAKELGATEAELAERNAKL